MEVELRVAVDDEIESEGSSIEMESSESTLESQQQTDSNFFAGGGCYILVIVYAILLSAYGAIYMIGMRQPQTLRDLITIAYPIYSIFALLSLHVFMYGCDLLAWTRTGVNYNSIFKFQSDTTTLKYRDAFLISTCMMASVVGTMIISIILDLHVFIYLAASIAPFIALAIPISVLMLIWPFKIFYYPTRYYFLKVIRDIVCSPFCEVLIMHIFMGDQLTSQIPLLRHVENIGCYFFTGDFKRRGYSTCESGKLYSVLSVMLSFAPYFWRAMQCARRWYNERDVSHIANMGKYASAIVAGGARVTYTRHPTYMWLGIVGLTSLIAMGYQLYWDFARDWGLLNRKSQNPWLRDNLLLKNKKLYFVSIGLNFIMRLAWLETVMQLNNFGVLNSRLLEFVFACVEVIRRGLWNYFRLENEHMSNEGS